MVLNSIRNFGRKIYSGLQRGGRNVLRGLVPSLKNKQSDLNENQKLALFFSNQAYQDRNNRRGINNYQYVDNLSSIYEAVFINSNQKIIYIAFRGTKPTDINDLSEDIQIVAQDLGKSNFKSISQRIRRGKELIDKLRTSYRDHQIKLTGHSLGGRISNELGRSNNLRSISFNAGGLDIMGNLTDRLRGRDNIEQITSGRDIISLGSILSPYTTIFKNPNIRNPLKTHSLSYFQ